MKIGFYIKRQHGSHIVLRRDIPFRQTVIPDHKELDRGTLRAIPSQIDMPVYNSLDLLYRFIMSLRYYKL